MKLSIIVPVVDPTLHINNLLRSISISFERVSDTELVIVNQSPCCIAQVYYEDLGIEVVEIMTSRLMSASDARNFGAKKARGKFLFFLDDDALVHASRREVLALIGLLDSFDLILCQRGEMRGESYFSHWPVSSVQIDQFNFSSFAIEWNIVVRKSSFLDVGGFPAIGTGSGSAALSGEAFLLLARLLALRLSVRLCDYISISHPSLIKPANTLFNLCGYHYGAGFAVGRSLRHFSYRGMVYWSLRVLLASVLDLISRKRVYIRTLPKVTPNLGYKLFKCRLIGFVDGVLRGCPRERDWL